MHDLLKVIYKIQRDYILRNEGLLKFIVKFLKRKSFWRRGSLTSPLVPSNLTLVIVLNKVQYIIMFKITQNIGSLDRIFRLFISFSFLYIGFFLLIGLIQLIFILIGLAFLINAITGFCGIYYVLGISTCRIPKKSRK